MKIWSYLTFAYTTFDLKSQSANLPYQGSTHKLGIQCWTNSNTRWLMFKATTFSQPRYKRDRNKESWIATRTHLENSGPISKKHTYMKGPSWQSKAIHKRRGGSLGFPSVKKNYFPVCLTTKGAMGATIFSKSGTPMKKGNYSKES